MLYLFFNFSMLLIANNLYYYFSADTPPPQYSRLANNLSETLLDEVALNYFSQFAELRGYLLLVTLWLDLHQLCNSCKAERNATCISERTSYTQCTSDSGSPLVTSCRDLCHRYLTEEVIQRYRLPEEVCSRIHLAVNEGVPNSEALSQLQDFVYQSLRRE